MATVWEQQNNLYSPVITNLEPFTTHSWKLCQMFHNYHSPLYTCTLNKTSKYCTLPHPYLTSNHTPHLKILHTTSHINWPPIHVSKYCTLPRPHPHSSTPSHVSKYYTHIPHQTTPHPMSLNTAHYHTHITLPPCIPHPATAQNTAHYHTHIYHTHIKPRPPHTTTTPTSNHTPCIPSQTH